MKVVIDSSPGADAAGALLWAATSGEVELVAAIGTWGNVSAAQASRNALAVLDAAGCDTPVYVGEDGPRALAPDGPSPTLVYGQDGLADVGVPDPMRSPDAEPAAAALVRLARDAPGEITLVCAAPMTTLAAALDLEPSLPSLLAALWCMAGAFGHGGNLTAAGEANVAHDPEAAALVVDAFGQCETPPHIVPLDITQTAVLGDEELDALRRSLVRGASTLVPVWERVWPIGMMEAAGRGWPAHDLITAWAVAHPDAFTWDLLPLAVDTGGSAAWGSTVADQRVRTLRDAPLDEATRAAFYVMMGVGPGRWSIAVDADRDAFRAGIRGWLLDAS